MFLNRKNFRNHIGKKVIILKYRYPDIDENMIGYIDYIEDDTCLLKNLKKRIDPCCLYLLENNVCKLKWEKI